MVSGLSKNIKQVYKNEDATIDGFGMEKGGFGDALHLGSILVILDLRTSVFSCSHLGRTEGGHGMNFGWAWDGPWATLGPPGGGCVYASRASD